MSPEPASVPVFIAYRQGGDGNAEGDECAEWLYENLQGRSIAIDGEQRALEDRGKAYRRDEDKVLAKGRRAGRFETVWRDPDASSLVIDLLSE